MMSALWVSKTGLAAQDMALHTISNNLANVSTVGFKRDRAVFEDLLYQIQQQPGANSTQDTTLPSGLQLGTGVRIAGTQKMFSMGGIQNTEAPLDMAIDGRGFFQITMPDGSIAYTRDGQFRMDQDGQIVNSQGHPLEPSITIPPDADTITIGSDPIIPRALRYFHPNMHSAGRCGVCRHVYGAARGKCAAHVGSYEVAVDSVAATSP